MKRTLLKWLEKFPVLYDIMLLLKYRNDDEFLKQVKSLNNNPNLVEFFNKQVNAEDKDIFCKIELNGENDGFFALVRWTLDALFFCDCFSLKPYVSFSKDCLYYDTGMPEDKNPYDYYFEQPLNTEKSIVEKSGSVVKYASRNRLKAEILNGGISYQVSQEYIVQMARIMKKYLHFNVATKKIVLEQLQNRGVGNTVLGVHIRGTDYKSNYKNHPYYIPPEMYYMFIDSAIKQYGFEKIYLATDDQEILEEFLKKYGVEKVLFDKDTVRSGGIEGIHTTSGIIREHHKYMLGMEVICDMCALAACGGLISSMSQVSLASRIYKKSRDEEFLYDKILNNGINQKGQIFKK